MGLVAAVVSQAILETLIPDVGGNAKSTRNAPPHAPACGTSVSIHVPGFAGSVLFVTSLTMHRFAVVRLGIREIPCQDVIKSVRNALEKSY